ncbi:cytochrome P450 93A3-like [Lotus japonicus]|uniref:cytochrome P450 93A3-like n=1 Tax=Lotus japonicus TaxID=34305 RepID=UPI00258E05B5|nr:cytochrome P450 93A3-like [Lotus japonicus]
MAVIEIQAYMQLFFILLLSTIVVQAILTRKKNKGHHPPSPHILPIVGHLHLISKLPHQSFHKLLTSYGPIVKLFLGSVPCVVASTPEIAKEFLKTHESCFSNRVRNPAIHYLSYGSKGFLFAPYGGYWKFMKKVCMSELLGSKTLHQHLPLRQQETLRFLRVLKNKGEAGATVDVGSELLTLTNCVITRMTMSIVCSGNDGKDVDDIRKMVTDTAELVGKFHVLDFFRFFKNWDFHGRYKKLKEIRDKFDTIMERVIKEHEVERKERGDDGAQIRDLLDILLEIHEDESTKIKLSRDNIKAFIMDIFMAGTDSSAVTIEWAMAELINHPQVMERARQEIDSVTGNKRLVQESDLLNLPYIRAIVKESLRIHPTLPLIGRRSTESCNVGGYDIPAKCPLFVNLWSMGRDPNVWENPLEFKPERFMSEEMKKFDVRGQNFKLMPFGTGRRVCPGASLALLVVPTNLAAMIQCFEWKVLHGERNGIVNMEEKPAISLPRAHPLICALMPRSVSKILVQESIV